jgi:hypothetical protein
MKIGITVLFMSLLVLLVLTAWKKCITTDHGIIFGAKCISYLGPVDMEDDTSYFFPKDTLEVYKRNDQTMYRINVYYDSSVNNVIVFKAKIPGYFYFMKGQKKGLYYYERDGYKICDADSVVKVNYKGVVINDTTNLSFLRNSKLMYDKDGKLTKEIYVMPSLCKERKDTSIFYYSNRKSNNVITLSSYIDSLRQSKLMKYEVFLCAPNTENPKQFSRITVKREIQDIGIISKKDSIYKIFNEMESQFNKYIK